MVFRRNGVSSCYLLLGQLVFLLMNLLNGHYMSKRAALVRTLFFPLSIMHDISHVMQVTPYYPQQLHVLIHSTYHSTQVKMYSFRNSCRPYLMDIYTFSITDHPSYNIRITHCDDSVKLQIET